VVKSSIGFHDRNAEYIPLRLTICNGIIPILEGMRPLEYYDALSSTDKPFWLQPEHESYQFLGKDNPFLG